jgi:type VI secretion system protein ImpA
MDCIDFNQLLQANSETLPSGEDLEYDPLFGEMERAAKGKDEHQVGDNLIAAEEPNWSNLKSHSLSVLAQSKDLRAAVLLTRALIRTDGYRGLADGLSLIQGFIADFWDSFYPQLDPEDNYDPTIRLNTLLNLCDPAEFLAPIAKLPLASSKRLGDINYRDIQLSIGDISITATDQQPISLEEVEARFRDTNGQQLLDTQQSILKSIASLEMICKIINQRVEDDRLFDLQPLSEQLNSASQWLDKWISPMKPDDFSHREDQDELTHASHQAHKEIGRITIKNREDVVLNIERICLYYELHEPSSPVPLLLKRAKRLVKMDFNEIVKDLAPDGRGHFDFLLSQTDAE